MPNHKIVLEGGRYETMTGMTEMIRGSPAACIAKEKYH